MDAQRPIGVFDSGVGGLTVLRALAATLPGEEFLYLGDTARLPYGTKSPSTVVRYALQAADELIERGIKCLVVACNTASAAALAAMRERYAGVPVIGVIEPGAAAACAASASGRIAVLATEGTVRGGAYQQAIARRRPDARVTALACPLFVALAFTFVLGCGAALYGPAWQSSVGEQVPRELVPSAVALNSLGFNIARTVGPAIGGAIVAGFGAQAAFTLNAVSYVGLIAVLAAWRYPPRERALPPESLGVAMLAGLRYARLSPVLVALFVRATIFGLMASAVWALMPLIARDLVKGGAIIYGVLLGAFGTGAMVGALTVAQLRQRVSNEWLVTAASITFGLASIAAALSPWLATTMLALVGAGAAWVMSLSTFNASVQVSSPRWVVGRTVAIYQMMTFGGLALGSWMWGEVAHALSLRTSLIASGAGLLVSVVLGRWMRVPQAENLDLESMRKGTAALAPRIDIVPQSGPVVINIEYRVATEDRVAFAAAMQELRRVRQRDGARGWTLLHDMDHPETWIERYHSPTWLAHQRRRLRLTRADQAIEERVRRLHRGDAPPLVHRYLERPPTSLSGFDKSEAERLGERASRTDPLFPGSAVPPDRPARG